MVRTPFPYPGGKSRFASWILSFVPEHTAFVEGFGGAAGVLFNKDPETSTLEIYNDRDGDLVQFFEVLREQPDELMDWIRSVPFSREQHRIWAHHYYGGYRPADDVERAGRFFFLRYAQWGSNYDSINGFATSKVQSKAQSFANKTDVLDEFAERLREVTIEELDYQELLEKYDGEGTVFYLDPPYVGLENYYPVGDIDHASLLEAVRDLEGKAIVSYGELPDGATDFWSVTREGEKRFINSTHGDSVKEATERLLFNFDPEVAE